MYYYLRKKPYCRNIKNMDGTTEQIYYSDDRALFKHHDFGRMYRMTFGIEHPHVRLWKVKSLKNVLRQRVALYKYSDEWFDVYDYETNKKIDIEYDKYYVPHTLDKAKTIQTLYYNMKTGDVLRDKPKDLDDYRVLRKGTVLKVYNEEDYYQMWECDFIEHSRDKIVLVDNHGATILEFNTWEEYTLNGSPIIKASWEDCKLDNDITD